MTDEPKFDIERFQRLVEFDEGWSDFEPAEKVSVDELEAAWERSLDKESSGKPDQDCAEDLANAISAVALKENRESADMNIESDEIKAVKAQETNEGAKTADTANISKEKPENLVEAEMDPKIADMEAGPSNILEGKETFPEKRTEEDSPKRRIRVKPIDNKDTTEDIARDKKPGVSSAVLKKASKPMKNDNNTTSEDDEEDSSASIYIEDDIAEKSEPTMPTNNAQSSKGVSIKSPENKKMQSSKYMQTSSSESDSDEKIVLVSKKLRKATSKPDETHKKAFKRISEKLQKKDSSSAESDMETSAESGSNSFPPPPKKKRPPPPKKKQPLKKKRSQGDKARNHSKTGADDVVQETRKYYNLRKKPTKATPKELKSGGNIPVKKSRKDSSSDWECKFDENGEEIIEWFTDSEPEEIRIAADSIGTSSSEDESEEIPITLKKKAKCPNPVKTSRPVCGRKRKLEHGKTSFRKRRKANEKEDLDEDSYEVLEILEIKNGLARALWREFPDDNEYYPEENFIGLPCYKAFKKREKERKRKVKTSKKIIDEVVVIEDERKQTKTKPSRKNQKKRAKVSPKKYLKKKDEDSGLYEVESILADKVIDGKMYYWVKWANYDERSWEPEQNLVSAQAAIDAFKKRKKAEDDDDDVILLKRKPKKPKPTIQKRKKSSSKLANSVSNKKEIPKPPKPVIKKKAKKNRGVKRKRAPVPDKAAVPKLRKKKKIERLLSVPKDQEQPWKRPWQSGWQGSGVEWYTVDEHHRVLKAFEDKQKSGVITDAGIRIVHFDSYRDWKLIEGKASVLKRLSEAKRLQSNQIIKMSNIGSWISPLLLHGMVTGVIWIAPPWCTAEPGSYELLIGIDKRTNKLGIASANGNNRSNSFLQNRAFVQENQVAKKRDLKYAKQFTFQIFKVRSNRDISKEDRRKIVKAVLPNKESKWMIDIDFSFFSAQNPVKFIFGPEFGMENWSKVGDVYTEIGLEGHESLQAFLVEEVFLQDDESFYGNEVVHDLTQLLGGGAPAKRLLKDFKRFLKAHYPTGNSYCS